MTKSNQIIIANVGNRSLIFKDDEVATTIEKAKVEFITKTNYRAITEEWLNWVNQDESFLGELRINILNALLSEKRKDTSHLYLIVSDQKESGEDVKHTRQDTLFAGELIKKLIAQDNDYQHIGVEIITYPSSVVDTEKLIPFYRSELLKLRKKHP